MQSVISFLDAVTGLFAMKPAAFWEPENRAAAFEELTTLGNPQSHQTFRGRRVVNPIYLDEPLTLPLPLPLPLPLLVEWLQLHVLSRQEPESSPEPSPMPVIPLSRTDTTPAWDKRELAIADCPLHKNRHGLCHTRNSRGDYSSWAPNCSCHLGMEEEEDWNSRREIDDCLNISFSTLRESPIDLERGASAMECRAYYLQRLSIPLTDDQTYQDALTVLTSTVSARLGPHYTGQLPPPWVVEFVYPGATSH